MSSNTGTWHRLHNVYSPSSVELSAIVPSACNVTLPCKLRLYQLIALQVATNLQFDVLAELHVACDRQRVQFEHFW